MKQQLAHNQLPIWAWCLVVIVLLTQGIWLFLDARKRGANHWFWGIWGLTQVPSVSIIYWLFVRGGIQVIKHAFQNIWRGRKNNE